jgi:hypothetical protein
LPPRRHHVPGGHVVRRLAQLADGISLRQRDRGLGRREPAILHALDQRDDLKLFAGVASHEPDYRPFAGRVATPRGGPPGREIGPGAAETPGGPRAHQRGP